MSEHPSATDIFREVTQSAGGVFRFGKGLMGKSAVLVFCPLLIIALAVWKLQNPAHIIGMVFLGVVVFFGWFVPMLRHTQRHPETALLEGAEWTAWKKFEASAKTIANPPPLPVIPDPDAPSPLPTTNAEEPDQ